MSKPMNDNQGGDDDNQKNRDPQRNPGGVGVQKPRKPGDEGDNSQQGASDPAKGENG